MSQQEPSPADRELLYERWLYRVLTVVDLAQYVQWCAQHGRTERAVAALRGLQDVAEEALRARPR